MRPSDQQKDLWRSLCEFFSLSHLAVFAFCTATSLLMGGRRVIACALFDLTAITSNPATLQQAWDEVTAQLYGFTDRIECQRPGQAFLELSEEEAYTVATTYRARVGLASSQEQAHLLALTADVGKLKRWTVEEASLPVSLLQETGLSPRSVERLGWLGVRTLEQLGKWSKAHLSRYLGAEAKTVIRYLKGPFTKTVTRYTPPVVLSEAYAFEEAVLEPWEISPVLEHLCNCLADELGDRAALRLNLVAEAQGLAFNATRVSKTPLRGAAVRRSALLAIKDSGALGLPIDKLSLTLSGLYRPSSQGSLWRQKENLAKAVKLVEARYPGAMLRIETVNPYVPVSEFGYRLRGTGSEVTGESESLNFASHFKQGQGNARERSRSLLSR